MAETTTIQGKIRLPSGDVVTKGRVIADLVAVGSVEDTVTDLIGGTWEFTIEKDGSVADFTLVPNDAITPSGTYYVVEFIIEKPHKSQFKRTWDVTTAPDPVDIGDINAPASLGSPSPQVNLRVPPTTSLPTPSAAWHRRKFIYIQPGMPDQEVICLDDGTGTYGWVVSAIGG